MTPKTPESAELLPCPFCGGNPETTPYFHIEAAMCGNKACPIFHIPINFETWNSRPTASAPADEAVKLNPERIKLYGILCQAVREFIEEYSEAEEGSEEWHSLVACVCDSGDRLVGLQPTVCRIHGLAGILDGISETPETMEQLKIQKEMERPVTDLELQKLSETLKRLGGQQ